MKKQNIIIGGGITGLYLAYRLCQKGQKVMVLEKNKKLGGLLEGFEISKNTIEKTYHHLFCGDNKATSLIKELGLDKNLDWYESSMSIYYGNKIYPFGGAIDLLRFDALNFVDRIRTGIVSLYLSKTNRWQRFEKITAEKYMKKMYGDQSYKVIWQPLLKSKFGKKYKKVSMAWMWARLNSRGNSKSEGKEKLGYLVGGFGEITNRLEQEILKLGGEIKTNVTVEKIQETKNGVVICAKSKQMRADRLFCCIDNTNFAKLIDSKKHKKYVEDLNSFSYLGAINLVFSSKQNLTDYYWNNINDTKSPFVAFVKHTQLVDKNKYNNENVYYLGAYVDTNDEVFKKDEEYIKKIYFDYLEKIVSDFDRNKIIQSNVFKYAKAQHLVSKNYSSKILPNKSKLKNVYIINYTQIYPKDRGINWSVEQIDKLLVELN